LPTFSFLPPSLFSHYPAIFVLSQGRTLSKCNHPQIVKIYDINLHESGWLGHRKQWFMVMEYIKGKTILEKMQTWEQQGYDPRFSEDDALRYIRQIAKALVFTHDRHPPILHRDLKPQNIMLRGDRDEAVLIDFGLAREFADAPVNTSKVMVSNGFAPIEQYSFNSIRQAATDVYGLAATLYYMVTNQLPTNANDRAQGNLLLSPQEYASVSDATCDAILKGLAFLASDRPQTMQEWLDLLPSPEYVEIVEHEDVDKDAIPDASVIENVICESTQKVWLNRSNYARLISKCQQIRERNLKLSKFLKPYPERLISFSLLLMPSTTPLVVRFSK
jgi:serine/threonine protein kinase